MNIPMDTCACGREKKKQAKYCIPCSNHINKLRWYLSGGASKERKEANRKELDELLEFHHNEPIKTKTTKMREKRAKENHLE
jgi:hypothetical protein